MQVRVSCLGIAIVGAALLGACGGSKDQASYPPPGNASNGYVAGGYQQPPPNTGYPPAGAQNTGYPPAGAQNTGYPPAGTPNTGYPPAGTPNTGYPPAGTQATTATTPPPANTAPATVQEVDASMAAPVQPLLQQAARSQVPPGAKPVGNMIVANFPQGGQLTKQVTLTLNKCYSVVAAGVPSVTEVNVKLMPVVPMLPALAEDKTTGPLATLGPNPNCYKQMFISAQANLVIEVPQGQGLVGVQVYEK